MKLIMFTTTISKDHDFGDFSKDKFSATKPDAEWDTDSEESVPEDKGLYFCAVRQHHSGTADLQGCTKTSVLVYFNNIIIIKKSFLQK